MKYVLLLLLLYITLHAQGNFSKGYPRWLSDADYAPQQTSGIANIISTSQEQQFLIVDDIGAIHRLIIRNDSDFIFHPVVLSESAQESLGSLFKMDIEEVSYDASTGKVYISIEGHGPTFRSMAGVFVLRFANNTILSDTIIAADRLSIEPEAQITEYLASNIGFEGIGVDEQFLYLALEGFQNGDQFADSTYIYVVDKQRLVLKHRINTHALGIHTICGLYAVGQGKLLVVDRNNWKIHYLELDTTFAITKHIGTPVQSQIPGYPGLTYTMALESISLDGRGNVYAIDDPWKSRFKPKEADLPLLDEQTKKNFENFIPIIYKFDLSTFTKE